jgi:hypothetical protein
MLSNIFNGHWRFAREAPMSGASWEKRQRDVESSGVKRGETSTALRSGSENLDKLQ